MCGRTDVANRCPCLCGADWPGCGAVLTDPGFAAIALLPTGARARVALTGLTVAEYFRDEEGQDVLLFVDNIFRFTQVSLGW